MGTRLYKANNWLKLQESKGSDPKVLPSYKGDMLQILMTLGSSINFKQLNLEADQQHNTQKTLLYMVLYR